MTGLERLRKYAYETGSGLYGDCGEGQKLHDGHCPTEGCRTCRERVINDIADQIEREQADDHEISEWVRVHGGLEHVRDIWGEMVNLCATIGCEPDIVTDALEALGECTDIVNNRLMPPGTEWPKVDSKKVDFTTSYGPSLGVLEAVEIYNNGACNVMSHDGIVKSVSDIHIAKQDHIGADGLHIHDDETVYLVDGNGEPLYVIDTKADGYQTVIVRNPSGHVNNYDAQRLTHTKPAIGADGLPIKKGETVYYTLNGIEFTVENTTDDKEAVWASNLLGNFFLDCCTLTHTKPEPPDSWERLESDMADDMAKQQCGPVSPEVSTAHAAEFVRRAKALAERERAE